MCVEFKRCVVTDAWFIPCLDLVIWRRQQWWCIDTTFHMREFLKCRQWSFSAEIQQQYYFLVAVITVWFSFVLSVLLICFGLSVFTWMFLAHNDHRIGFKDKTITFIKAAHLLIKHQWEQTVTAQRDAWNWFCNILVSSSTFKSTSLIINSVIIQKGLWSLTQLLGLSSKSVEYWTISAPHFVPSSLSSHWY